MNQGKNLSDVIMNLLDVFVQFQISELVEYIWHDPDMSFDDLPFEEVEQTLELLEKENQIQLLKDEDLVRLNPEYEQEKRRTRALQQTLTKWRATIIGSYNLPDNSEIDIEKIYEILQETRIDLGTKRDEITENNEIDLDWSLVETRCESRWSSTGFHIHAYTFEEPMPEIIEYMARQTQFKNTKLLEILPTSGALLVYYLMRSILLSQYPAISIRLNEVDLRLTKGG
jgi:hypothetical protein